MLVQQIKIELFGRYASHIAVCKGVCFDDFLTVQLLDEKSRLETIGLLCLSFQAALLGINELIDSERA